MLRLLTCGWLLFGVLAISSAEEKSAENVARDASAALDRLLERFRETPGLVRSTVGVTRQGITIPALHSADDLDPRSEKFRLLLIGGLDSSASSTNAALALAEKYFGEKGKQAREQFTLAVVPVANPEGWFAEKGPANLSGGNPTRGYPPRGDAYSSPTDPEAAYLWRWIGIYGPDLVIDLRQGTDLRAYVSGAAKPPLRELASRFASVHELPADEARDDLVTGLMTTAACGTGTIPALRLTVAVKDDSSRLAERMTATLSDSGLKSLGPSPARQELQSRLSRTPRQVAEQLSRHYGHELNSVVYIPAVALMGRMRLGELVGDASHLKDVERIVAPYVAGEKEALPKNPSGSVLSGHLVFGELAHATGNRRYVELVRAAADLAFEADGSPKEAMPSHSEMSDAVFMGCPILVQAGRLTGEQKYYDMALRHLRFMLQKNLRTDGLHRHSPLDETAWGRGNGFPALGLVLCLSELPEESPIREEMLREFRTHLDALAPHQDRTGMWRQVVDHPGSYRELSCTCMITYAILRGIRSGWLDRETWLPRAELAWQGIRQRVAADGRLVDVCTGTGKQRSLRDYLDRTAILGPDPRGGAMALLVATEMARWEAEQKAR